MGSLEQDLEEVVGARQVWRDPELTASYERDYTGRYQGRAKLVARPADTDEVAAVMAACAAHENGVVAQGGNTGLVGGGVPRDGEVVISLARLEQIGEV